MLWLLLLLLMLLIPLFAGALIWWETRTYAASPQTTPAESAAAEQT